MFEDVEVHAVIDERGQIQEVVKNEQIENVEKIQVEDLNQQINENLALAQN